MQSIKRLIKYTLSYIFHSNPLEKLEWEDVNICPLCGGASFRQRSRHWWLGIRISLIQCLDCNLVIQSPRLSPKGLKRYYDEHYRTATDSVKQESLFLRGMRRGAYIKEYLIANEISCEGKHVVEVGCGYGGILEVFRNSGCDVIGCDVEPSAVKFAAPKGLDVRYGGVETLSDTSSQADIVILSHVLEHIPKPIQFLQDIATLLKTDGVLYVEVPGIENSRVIENNDAVQPGHLLYFTQETLAKMCETGGFRLVADNNIVQAIFYFATK